MKRTWIAAAIAALALALPAFARVISYAPYTNTPAAPGLHSRTSRFFVLLEGSNEFHRQVVMYDSTEREEPRVVYPTPASRYTHEPIEYAALYERAGDERPMLLIGTYSATLFSGDGGTTWTSVPGLSRLYLRRDAWVDYGGASTQPLWHPVQPGNDHYPFFIHYLGDLYAIDADGLPKKLSAADRLIGSDRERNRFLIRLDGNVEMIDVWGNRKSLFAVRQGSAYEGWITPAGQAYIVEYVYGHRFLYHYRNRNLYFVAGPYDTPPPVLAPPATGREDLRFFAVPTHDYNGAWMIQRQEGRPTTLLRHIGGEDLEVMWSDPTGREVEALIPGRSGETLLVQVHIPRVEQEDVFADPALAVWRVGTPMPEEYDELYVHEEANKGFLHVDVDRMTEGEMFVFNSGLTFDDRPAEGPISAPIESGADIFQEWGVVRASLRQRLVLPGVTRTAGANGSQWSTDITIYNPLDVPQQVEVRYIGSNLEQSAARVARLTRTVTIAPRGLHFIPDVLNSLFLVAGSGGSLLFTPEVGVSVFGRTYSRSVGGGTYGYGLHAIDFFNAAGPRFPLTFSGAFPGGNFRTNVMLTDTSGRGTAATIGSEGLATLASGVTQWSSSRTASGALELKPTRGMLIPTVVAIDDVTNDATYFPPDSVAAVERMIPLVMSTEQWQTDFYLHNPSPYHRGMRLRAVPWDGSPAVTRPFFLSAGQSHMMRDVLKTTFGLTGRATLYYVADDATMGEGIRATSRLYATDANGGTYGTLAPPLNSFQIARPGDTLSITGISGGNAYQTNLSLVTLSGSALVEVRIVGEHGEELAKFQERVNRASTFEDLFARQGLTPPRAARVEVELLAGSQLGTFATLVDRTTGDPTYLPANLSAK